MYKALAFENLEQNHSILSLPNHELVSVNLLKRYILFLTEKGEIWKSGEFPDNDSFNNFEIRRVNDLFLSKPSKIVELGMNKIISVSCNNNAIHAVSGEGQLFSWGLDSDNTGILGLGDIKSQKNPMIVDKLKAKKIKYVHTGNKHASAIDSSGHIYLWGTGFQGEIGVNGKARYSRPHMINIPDVLNCKKSYCNKTTTFMITFGGKLYMLGCLKKGERSDTSSISNVSQHDNKKHSQLQEIRFMKPMYVQDIVSGEGFAVALTSQGELFQINYGLESSKILINGEVNSVGMTTQKFYAVNNDNDMYEWDLSYFINTFDLMSPSTKKGSAPKISKIPDWMNKPKLQSQLFSRNSLLLYCDFSDNNISQVPNFSSVASNNRQSLLQDFLTDPYSTYRRQSDNENYSDKMPVKGKIKDTFFNLNLASPASVSLIQSPAVNDSVNPKRKNILSLLDSVHCNDTGRPSITKELNALKQKLDWRGNNSNNINSSLAFNETLKPAKNVSKFFDSNGNINSPLGENQFFDSQGIMSLKKRNKSLEDSFHNSSGKLQRDSSIKRDERKKRNKQKIEEISKQLKSKLMTQNIKENIKAKNNIELRKKEFTRELLRVSPTKKGFGNSQIRLFSEENSFNFNDDLSSNFSHNAHSEIPRRDNSNNTTAISNLNLNQTSNTPNILKNKEKENNDNNQKKMVEDDGEIFKQRPQKREKRNFNVDIMSIGVEKKVEKPGKSLEYFIGLIKSTGNNKDDRITSTNEVPQEQYQYELPLIQEASESNSSFVLRRNNHAGGKSSFLPGTLQASGNTSQGNNNSRSQPHIRNKSLTPYDQSLQNSNHTRSQFSPVFYQNNTASFAENYERLNTNGNRPPSISSFERVNTFGGLNRSIERGSVVDSLKSRETFDLDKIFERRNEKGLDKENTKTNTTKRAEHIMNQYKKVLKESEIEEKVVEARRALSSNNRRAEAERENLGLFAPKEKAQSAYPTNSIQNMSNQNISRSDSYSMFCHEDGLMTRDELQDEKYYQEKRDMIVFETFRNEEGIPGERIKLDVKQEKSILVGDKQDANKQINTRKPERGFTFALKKGTVNEPFHPFPAKEELPTNSSQYQQDTREADAEELHELSFRNEKESEFLAKKIVKRAFENAKVISAKKSNINLKTDDLGGNSHLKEDLKSMYSPTKEICLGSENIENAVKNLMNSFDNISDLKQSKTNVVTQVQYVNPVKSNFKLFETEECSEANLNREDSFTRCIMQLTEKIPELNKQDFKKLTREIMDKIFPKRTPLEIQEEENLIQQVIDNITRRYNSQENEEEELTLSNKNTTERLDVYREKKKNISSPTKEIYERVSPVKINFKEDIKKPFAFEEKSNDKKASCFGPRSDEKKARFDQLNHNEMPLQMKSFSLSEQSHSNISLCKITPIRPRMDSQRLERFIMILALIFERNRMKRYKHNYGEETIFKAFFILIGILNYL